jgi:hypothetical protein
MRGTVIVALLFAPSCGVSLYATPQDQASKSDIEQQLKTQCPLTRVGTNGVVVQAGCVLVVQEDNIKAIPASYQHYWVNSYKTGGRVKQSHIQNVPGGLPDASELRFLQVGEKVYLASIEVKNNDIIFKVQSCGVCDPNNVDQNNPPFRAALSFQFEKGFVASANIKEIQDTIAQIFAMARAVENSTTTEVQTRPLTESKAPEKPPDQIAPPPPPDQPPPPPKTVSKGDTKDQVVAALGQPERIAKVDAKEIYFYKDMKVTLLNGKVTDIQ